MASIKKIAEKAGVSPATVSRVLNNPNYRCASPEKRDKIWKAAMELNYVPNEAARNLRTGKAGSTDKTYYINVLVTRTEAAQTDPFFAELLHVIETEIHKQFCILSKVWYLPVFCNDHKCRSVNLDQVIGHLTEECDGRKDGLIVIGKCNKEALRKLVKSFKNVVSVNRNSTNHEVDEVTCDGRGIATIAVEYLISLGHRDIGYVGECHNEARYNGFCETLAKHDIELDRAYVIETKQTEAEGYETMKKLLESGDVPTGIYCANDITAIGMLKCLNKTKNRYFSISIVASDNIEEAQFSTPMLSTVAVPKEEMGKFTMYLLLDRIRGGHKNIVSVEFEGTLIKRESCHNVTDRMWNDYCI
ncbi:MAG: LacI family DNA-binding transcriptional regulator [Lachnospiraceae bacterium]|nr:LacI family DNA-binding transcriptional regulator [Lachnospiraceae bacterium]